VAGGAICPAYGRGCYGCFGPVAEPNTAALVPQLRRLGMDTAALLRVFATFNVAAPGFAKARDEATTDPGGRRRSARDRWPRWRMRAPSG
jgi:hypothetical protein